jgi:predicted ATPase
MRQIDNRDRFAPRDRPEPHWSEVLRALRETAGVTQEGWAAQLGHGRRSIQRWEHAELAPDAAATEALVRLCTQLGLFREHQRGVLAGLRLTPEWLGAVLVDARAAGPSAPAPVRVLTSGALARPVLRVPLTSFVGRQREMAEIRRLLATTRLLTLTGPGGVGKTRLALEVARAVSAEFSSGIWLVELGPLADPELVPQALATVLGMREQPGRPLLATLADRLRGRRVLVLLDNCEHLIGACAELAATLLAVCPELCVLATSRVVLGVSGETTWLVPALSVPGPQRESAREADARSDAVQLFVQRASAVAPRFALTEDTTPAIVNICARLDGLPLAIELAAAWMRMLSPHQLARRLADPFALLVSAARDTPARQRTLRATLDWSYGLLAEPERRLLARLSVFVGAATLDAIEAVGENAGERGEAVVHGLARLVDASLVQRLEAPGAEVRFRLLDTVREYAREQLMSLAEAEDARRRHATTFRDLAEEARTYLLGPWQGSWLDRLERDHDNLRAALSWAIERNNAECAGGLAASLWLFWYHRGHLREGRALLDAVLAMSDGPGRATIRVDMLKGNALLALGRGEFAAARGYAEEGVRVARQHGDRTCLMEILGTLGFAARAQGDPALARESLQESLGLARHLDHTHGAARSLHHLGLLALEAERDHTAAWSLSEQSLVLARRIGERRLEGNILMAMARVARAQGKASTARSLLAEASTAYQQVGDPGPMPGFLTTCAAVAADAGHFERAVRLAALAARLMEVVGIQERTALRELNSWLPAARRALGEQTFATTWAQAAAMALDVESAVARALAEASSTTVGGPTA